MKKIIALTLALLLLTGVFSACGKSGENTSDGQSSTGAQSSGPSGTLEEIIAKIYEIKKPEFMLGNIPVDMANADSLKAFTGLDSPDKIKEVSASEALTGSQAYSLVLVRLNDSKDAGEVAASMKSGINTRKWICVEADDLRVVAAGDVVMLVMISTEFADSVTADQLADAFKTVSGGSLSVDLK